MKYQGHNNTILHEADIRRPRTQEYYFLNDSDLKEEFINELSNIIDTIEFFHITTIVDKNKISGQKNQNNIYEFALLFCMERLHKQLKFNQKNKTVDIVIEARGKREDEKLELEFRRILDGQQQTFRTDSLFDEIQYRFHTKGKDCNIVGLQIADLIARPIGVHYLKSEQPNRAYDIINGKNEKYCITQDETIKIYPQKNIKTLYDTEP